MENQNVTMKSAACAVLRAAARSITVYHKGTLSFETSMRSAVVWSHEAALHIHMFPGFVWLHVTPVTCMRLGVTGDQPVTIADAKSHFGQNP